jgi:peptidoglycan DL-endopeptidase CwlO
VPPCGSQAPRRWLALLLTGVLAATVAAPAGAEPTSTEARARIAAAQERLDQLEITVGAVVDEFNAAQEALDRIQSDHDATKAEYALLRADVSDLQDVVEEHVRRLYKLGPALELSTLVAAGGPTDTGARLTVMRRILEGQRIDLEEYEALQIALAVTEHRLAEQRAEADRSARELEERRIEVEATIAATQDEIARHNRDLRAAIDREEAAARAEQERQQRVRAEAARQQRLSEQATPSPTRPSPSTPSSSAAAESRPESRPESSPAPAARGNAQVAVDAALSRLGNPYRWGATGPNAFDCSGLMVWAWAQAGVSLPRTSSGQFAGVRRISRSELQPGDLVFAGSPSVHHVGMYIGNGQIVHSPYTGATVSIRSMNRPDIRGYGRPG